MFPARMVACLVLCVITSSSAAVEVTGSAGAASDWSEPVIPASDWSEAAPRTSDDSGDSDDLVSRVLGVPGVWWPATQVT